MQPRKRKKNTTTVSAIELSPRYVLMVSIVFGMFSLSLFLDHILSKKEILVIKDYRLYQVFTKRKVQGYRYEAKFTNGTALVFQCKGYDLVANDSLLIDHSPFYDIVHSVDLIQAGELKSKVPESPAPYLLFGLATIILGMSIAAPLVKNNDVVFKLLLADLFFCLLTYYIFGRPNYF